MTDYSKMTDEELIATYQALKSKPAAPAPAGKDYASMTDAELIEAHNKVSGSTLLPTVDEMHPDLTFFDRLIVKNLSNDSNAATEYLQKKHPNMVLEPTPDGNIRARNRGETQWKVLDPSGFDLQDITDVAYDVGAGVVEGAATAGAGVAGAVAGGGVGAIPAAMAGGAASSAGMESLRQLVGKAAGVNKEFMGDDVAMAAGFGAVSPMLFGTGAAAKQVAKAGIAQATQKGYLRKGVQKLAPKLGETVSGISSRAIKTFSDRMPEVLKIEQEGMKDVVTETAEELTGTLRDIEKKEWRAFENSLQGAPEKIELADSKAAFESLYQAAKQESMEIRSPEARKFADKVKSTMDAIFPADVARKTDTRTGRMIRVPAAPVSPLKAMKVQRRLSDIAKFGDLKPGQTPMVGRLADLTENQRRLSMAAEDASRSIGGDIAAVAQKYGGLEGKQKYMEMVNLRKSISKHFKDPQTTYNTLRNINSKGRQALSETFMDMDKRYGTNLESKSNLMEAVSMFAKPTLTALSGLGSTSTSRTIPMALAGGGLGYYLGAQSGLGQGGAGIGTAIGGLAGSLIGGPKSLRAYMKMNRAGVAGMAKARDMRYIPTNAAPFSAWNMMNNGGEQ